MWVIEAEDNKIHTKGLSGPTFQGVEKYYPKEQTTQPIYCRVFFPPAATGEGFDMRGFPEWT